MKTNKSVLVLVAMMIIVLSSFGLRAGEEKDLTVTMSTDFVSQYIGFGNGGVFYNKPMFQTDLAFTHKSGFHADIWWGTGFNNDLVSSGFDDEIDWNIGFANAVPFTNGKLQFDLGVGYWDLYSIFTSTRNDVLHPFVEVTYPFDACKGVKLTLFARFEGYNLPFETDFEEGTITSAGCKYRVEISRKLSITGLTSLGYDDGGFGFQRGIIWKDYTTLEWAISNHLMWKVVEFQFYVPLGVNDRDPQQVYGTGIVWTF